MSSRVVSSPAALLLLSAVCPGSMGSPASAAEADPAWIAEAEDTAARIREAVIRGVKAGRKERIFVEVGRSSRRARLVAASEAGLVVSVGGAEMPVRWEKTSPRRLYHLGRAYLPADDARTRLALGRYCAVHGLFREARDEVVLAVGKDARLRGDAARVTDFLRAAERARAAAASARSAKVTATRSGPAPASRPSGRGKIDRAAYIRAALGTDAATHHRRLGPDFAHYSKGGKGGNGGKEKGELPEVFQRHADGVYAYEYEEGEKAADWTGMAGQVLYVPVKANGTGCDRVRFNWSFHEGHGGTKYWHVYQLAPTMKEWYCKSPDPGLRLSSWIEAAGGGALGLPVAVARAKVSWSNCGIAVFRNGVVGATGYGNNDDRYPCTRLPPGMVPTAVAVTPNNEFALVAVCDVRKAKGALAVVALEARALAHHSWHYAGLPNVGTYTRLKVMGLVDLPGMSAPSAVAAAGDASRWRWTTAVSKERLDSADVRARWLEGGDDDHRTCGAGYALVVSREEDRATFVDLGPLYQYMRLMYFTTKERFEKTANEGPRPDQWPFTFDVAPEARPKVVTTIPVPRPTAVAAGFAAGHGVRDRDFVNKAFVATEDGRFVIFDVESLISPGRGSGAVRPVGTVHVGRNPTCIAYGRHGHPHDDLVIVSRGERELVWVEVSGNSGRIKKRLRDKRLVDPVHAELWDTRGAGGISVADFKGRKVVNYLYRPVNAWGDRLFGGLGEDGEAEFECTGVLEVPGYPFMLSSAEVN